MYVRLLISISYAMVVKWMDEKKNEYLTTKNLFFVCLVVNRIICYLIDYLNCVGLNEKKRIIDEKNTKKKEDNLNFLQPRK